MKAVPVRHESSEALLTMIMSVKFHSKNCGIMVFKKTDIGNGNPGEKKWKPKNLIP